MSDDLLRIARQFLAELQASETHLRASAVVALPYPTLMAAERRGARRCAELLATMGSDAFSLPASPVNDDTTDELLRNAVRARDVSTPSPSTPRPSGAAQSAKALGAAESVGAFASASLPGDLASGAGYEPFDDGPEGAADDRNDPPSESDEYDPATRPASVLDDDLPVYDDLVVEQLPDIEVDAELESEDDDTDETPVPAPVPPPTPAAPRQDSFVSFDDPVGSAAASGSLVSFDDVPPSDDEPTLGGSTARKAPTDVDSLVSYDDSDLDDSSETIIASSAEVRAPTPVPAKSTPPGGLRPSSSRTPPPALGRTPMGSPPRVASFSDVGADALVTVEERSSDLLQGSLDDVDDVQELELDNSDSFDLMPDVADDDGAFEDEEVTMVKAADTADWEGGRGGAAVATAKAGAAKKPGPFTSGASGAYASDSGPVVGDAAEMASSATPKPTARRPAPPKPIAATAAVGGGKTTAGLYGGSGVPTIRDSDEPRPRAAAIQLNAGGAGGGKVLGLEEEEEPIEIGAAEDYGDEEEESDLADGFSVTLQAHDEPDFDDDSDEEEEEEEEEEELLEPIEEEQAPPAGPTADELRAMLEHAASTAASGDLQGGADLYSDALDADPDSIEAHVARGRLYLDLGDYSRAMSDFMVAEDLAPDDPEPHVAIGDLYFARKDYRKAIDYFNAALDVAPNHPMAYCRRGISHYYRKNYQEAVTDLLRAEKLDPDIPNIQTYVSMAKKKTKR